MKHNDLEYLPIERIFFRVVPKNVRPYNADIWQLSMDDLYRVLEMWDLPALQRVYTVLQDDLKMLYEYGAEQGTLDQVDMIYCIYLLGQCIRAMIYSVCIGPADDDADD